MLCVIGFMPRNLVREGGFKTPQESKYLGVASTRDIHVCILLVEDESLIREIMAESLEDAGYVVIQAATGDEALSVIQDPPARITALVTDFHMPGEADGADVASCIREKWPGIPVVIASGRPDVLQQAWQARFGYRLLKKPYGPRQLVGMLRDLTPAA
jgi:DNA-binding response OmpR family regulator